MLTRRVGGRVEPCSLPIFGTYDGQGFFSDVVEGKNAEWIGAAITEGLEMGELVIDWKRLGLEPFPLDHLESVISVIACSQLHDAQAVHWCGDELGAVLLEGNILAALMQREEQSEVATELCDLPHVVFPHSPQARAIYRPFFAAPLAQKCRFGLSLLGFLKVREAVGERGFQDAPRPQRGVEGQARRWCDEAIALFSGQPDLQAALADYLTADPHGSLTEG